MKKIIIILILLSTFALADKKPKPEVSKTIELPNIDLELINVGKEKRTIKVHKDFQGMKKNIPDSMEFSVPIDPTVNSKKVKVRIYIDPK